MKYFFEKTGSGFVSEPSVKEVFSSLKPGEYEMELTRKKDARTSRQNRLLWAWLTQLETQSHVGYTKDEWLEVFRTAFLSRKRRNPLDRRKWVCHMRSTAELDTVEFNEFIEKIRVAALLPNVWPIRLQYPDEIGFDEWIKSFA